MFKLARSIPMFCLALIVLMIPLAATQASAAGKNKLKITVNKSYWLVKPGDMVRVEVNVQKKTIADTIDLMLQSSPLEIRKEDDAANSSSLINHTTLFVTVPATINGTVVDLGLTATNSKGKSKSARLTFNLNDPTPDVDFYIGAAAFSAPSASAPAKLFLGGVGFGSSPRVIVNGLEVTAKITSAQNTMVELVANSRDDLNFIDGPNEIIIDVNGRITNRFILNLGVIDIKQQ